MRHRTHNNCTSINYSLIPNTGHDANVVAVAVAVGTWDGLAVAGDG